MDLLHLIDNVFTLTPALTLNLTLTLTPKRNGFTTLDRKRIHANPSSYPNPNANSNPNTNPNPKAQSRFRTDKVTSFFDQVYR